MKINKTIYLVVILILTVCIFTTCDDGYRVGNRITLDLAVNSKINFDILDRYLRTLSETEYQVREKWKGAKKIIDLDSANSFRIYFKESPEEMYIIQFNGVLLIADVLNDNIVKGDYVTTKSNLPAGEELRIRKRFQTEILDKIEKMARNDGVPDSVLFLKPWMKSYNKKYFIDTTYKWNKKAKF